MRRIKGEPIMPNELAEPAIVSSAGPRENWRELAACRSAEPELFFPAEGAERAKAVCGTCAVRRECLQFALATGQPYGVWGGMSAHERRVARA